MTAIHINRPSSTRFVAVARQRGHRNWTTIQSSRSQGRARAALLRAMNRGAYHRGEVLIVADYYDPVTVFSMRAA